MHSKIIGTFSSKKLRSLYQKFNRRHGLWIISGLGTVYLLFIIIRIYPIFETIRLSFYRYHIIKKKLLSLAFKTMSVFLEMKTFILH